MNRVVRLTNWREPIEEGYFPKLDNILANRVWPPRHVNSKLQVIVLKRFEKSRHRTDRDSLVFP